MLGCKTFEQPTPRFGKEFNAERERLGVPIIPDEWIVTIVSSQGTKWSNPDKEDIIDSRIPFHVSKGIYYGTGELISETDSYFGMDDWVDLEGNVSRESLDITYNYQIDENDWKKHLGWSAFYRSQETMPGKEITLEEAIKILQEWNINFP